MTGALFAPPSTLTLAEVLASTGGRLVAGPGTGAFAPVTDSRLAGPGTLFIALTGETHDGHDFVPDATHRGSAALVSSRWAGLPDVAASGPTVVVVQDTLVALGDLARFHLHRSGPAVAAVTGSVGKTTTRAMLGSMLRAALGPGLESEGNFNNRIGVPLTILHLRPEHRWAVLEMGMSEPGEIRALAAIARPRVRVITQVAAAHLAFFSSVEQIADAKGELFEEARPGDALVFPFDQPLYRRFPRPWGARLLAFSMDSQAPVPFRLVAASDLGLDGSLATLDLAGRHVAVRVPLPGRHQIWNALAAAAAATELGVDGDAIAEALARIEVPGRRMRREERGGVTILDDAYNANPASVEAALRTLAALPASGRRVAALGDMLELGPTGPALHEAVGRLAAELGISWLVGVGPLMADAVEAAARAGIPATHVPDAFAAGELLRTVLAAGDILLMKGSRGMRMEGLLDRL
jgi:UDP-N-acetylmuramoyl-tripeptide--D-alanyl-D-alanine ligase